MPSSQPAPLRRTLIAGAVLVLAGGAAVGAYMFSPVERTAAETPMPALGQHLESQIARGEYVARAADCAPCHTKPGGAPFAGGLEMQTPFGTMASANITPDPQTGIGGWTRDAFARAVREGVTAHPGNLYPTMTFTSYAKMSDADIDALYAYIMSLPPVRQAKPDLQLDFPFNQRFLLSGWRKLFFDNSEFTPDPALSDEVNLGAYLIEGPAHCAECHTPRNALGAMRKDMAFAGAQIDGFWAPNLTPDAETGLGDWSEDEIFAYLSGQTTAHGGPFGPMYDVVAEGTSHLTETDLRAMAAYLHQLPPIRHATGEALDHAAATASVERGRVAYRANCAACHRLDGEGVPDFAPALANHHAVGAAADNVIMPVLTGLSDKEGRIAMPAFLLDDRSIADIANYVRNAMNETQSATATPEQVAAARATLH
ncbi:c-type cytochrome [Pseudodonghicola flavimaris]|uniref:C-type cytochrome n=1 Tax=Pseudodonghicola flavimaris TaxID=3050036 RepID=A0ABT7F5H0_9RHOB|nr:c-type cytochrome [Pseudodonghicola flavimaris]MDK3019827.1 c-type cytochrome [Pseudodonghicola flavimaris]